MLAPFEHPTAGQISWSMDVMWHKSDGLVAIALLMIEARAETNAGTTASNPQEFENLGKIFNDHLRRSILLSSCAKLLSFSRMLLFSMFKLASQGQQRTYPKAPKLASPWFLTRQAFTCYPKPSPTKPLHLCCFRMHAKGLYSAKGRVSAFQVPSKRLL